MEENENTFEIRIDFERGTGDPARVFRAMTGLIESTERLDEHLSATISVKVRTSVVLQDVEATSLKAKLKTIVEEIPDDAVREGNIKKVIGHFLHKAKHKVIDWCSERNEIKDREEVKLLESEIHNLAEQTNVNLLPAYAAVETGTLLSDINSVKTALDNLEENDKATFTSQEGESTYNQNLSISENVIHDIVTREVISSKGERIVKVKKPDYLGASMWGFKYAGHLIEAKILDERWINQFHTRQIILQPGDSLRVVLSEEISYGYDNEIVHVHYEVTEVIEIIPEPKHIQADLLDDE